MVLAIPLGALWDLPLLFCKGIFMTQHELSAGWLEEVPFFGVPSSWGTDTAWLLLPSSSS